MIDPFPSAARFWPQLGRPIAPMLQKLVSLVFVVFATVSAAPTSARCQSSFTGQRMPYEAFDQLSTTPIQVGGGTINVGFAPGTFVLPQETLLAWLKKSAEAVTVYYGRFPVKSARLLIVPVSGRGVQGGTAFGYRGPAIRLLVGMNSSQADLDADWKAVHEMVHLALPDLPGDSLWLAEGLAVYVESIARVQAGDLTPEKIWGEFARDMPHGLPASGDRGLDQTHTWGRTYWGGAIFYLLADVEIRKRSNNILGLQQAMRGVVAAGGTHDRDWSVERVLAVAGRAVKMSVMTELHDRMGPAPYDPDLPQLWRDLGVSLNGSSVKFDDSAPLAAIRRAITARLSDTDTHVN